MEEKKLAQLKKLQTLQEEPNLAFFDELRELNDKLEPLQSILSEINSKEAKTYEMELKTLQEAILSLTESVNNKDTVVNIPLDQLSAQLVKVESAIKAIGVFKEMKIPEFPTEMSLNEVQVNELLLAIESIPPFPIKELEKLMNSLAEKLKVEKQDIEEFDYDRLDRKFNELVRAVKNVSIVVSGGGGVGTESYFKGVKEITDNQTNGTQQTQILGKTSDTTYQVPRIDVSSHSLVYVDFAHSKIHAGEHFMYTDCLELDSAATQVYLLTTPNTTTLSHLSFSIEGSAITALDVYEGADRTGTTAQTIFNNNRNSLNTSVNTLHKGVSGGTTDGTKIWCHKSGSATNQSLSGASSEQASEIILKQNTKYLLRVTSSTVDNLVNLKLGWYENISKGV